MVGAAFAVLPPCTVEVKLSDEDNKLYTHFPMTFSSISNIPIKPARDRGSKCLCI